MPSTSVTRRISLVSFIVGFILTYISPFREYLWGFQQIFYSETMSAWQFGVVWGLIVAGFMYGGYKILKNRGHWSMVGLVFLLGFFYLLFMLLTSGIFSGALV